MRLKSIKLAGFKSFVDPTTVRFPSNLASLVGPNGCGKSNLIDAVRWVMGESSAKQLRGTAMADVIFNGSGDRQPLGQASIELLFDNATGRIGGEYAAYNEIAVRRSITRDGQSDFLLNGTRCRRRDITDLFLGTGLGPRSYSIIEQGMISSLITARPDELRTYIEEAAGISKYRERRRDTENRIARTRENLARLTDLRDELGRQLARLQRQSKIAEKYRRHRAQQRDLEQQLLALRWRTLDTAAAAQKEQVTAAELEVEKRTAAELACASQIEKHRSTAAEQSDTLNAIQARYYQAGAEIARLEQTLQHREERRQQRAAELAQTDQSCVETRALIAADQTRARGWQAELEELARQRQQAETALKTTATALEQAEQRQAAAQQKWDHFTAQEQAAQRAAVAESRHTHAQQALESLEQRRTALATQLADQNPTAPECPDELQTQQAALDQRLAAATKTEQTQSQAIAAARTALHQQAADIDTLRTARQEARGRLASLEALQQAAVSAEPTDIENWLHTRDLATAPRLADQMQVAPGWEHAVETVLGSNLRALRLPDLTPIAEHLETLKTGTLTLVDDPLPAATTENEKNPHLSTKVTNPPAAALLAGIRIAPDLPTALKIRPHLHPGESVITQSGIWLGPNWCKIRRGDSAGTGVIERNTEIAKLQNQIDRAEKRETKQAKQLLKKQADLQTLESQQADTRQARESLAAECAQIAGELAAQRSRHQQQQKQHATTRRELADLDTQIAAQQQQLTAARTALAAAQQAAQADSTQREKLQQQRDQATQDCAEHRNRHQKQRDSLQQLMIRERTVGTQLDSLKETMQRIGDQLDQLLARRQTLATDDPTAADPATELAQELQKRLNERLDIDQQLNHARQELQTTEQRIRDQEAHRQQCAAAVLKAREQLQEHRLQAQDQQTRKTTLEEQLQGQNPQAILRQLPPDANEQEWAEQLTKLQARIAKLGPVNLAAIDEYQTESERKNYLDAQNEELVTALQTLENAIAKIDRETRARFKETFDQINAGFKTLFPRLFGGGNAYLELTDSDLLETGVAIMARPPGKRNSSIQLLSGGEKAMTAIALVFAIFQLNPAPFCVLDEVDAPLDDANAARFAEMLQEMATQVQFIIITHNKITMQIAEQLLGITMHEPGVSRVVSVDVESAMAMAAA